MSEFKMLLSEAQQSNCWPQKAIQVTLIFLTFLSVLVLSKPEIQEDLNSSSQKFNDTKIKLAPKSLKLYELKFQNEPVDLAFLKYEGQQKILRCQVRLAPINSNSQLQGRARLKVKATPITLNNEPNQLSEYPEVVDKPVKVNLTIEWLRNYKPLADSLAEDEQISRIEVKLKSQNNKSNRNKGKNMRIEIKNTLNEAQYKLTSRLKLSSLRVNDTGQYKCMAKVTFTMSANESSVSGGQPKLFNFEQSLDSNGIILMVANESTSTDADSGHQHRIGSNLVKGIEAIGQAAVDTNSHRMGSKSERDDAQGSLPKLGAISNILRYIIGHQSHTPPPSSSTRLATGSSIETAELNSNSTSYGNSHWISMNLNTANVSAPHGYNKNQGSVKNMGDVRRDNSSNDEYDSFRSLRENQFEDDEDLFKMEQERGADVYISGLQEAPSSSLNGDALSEESGSIMAILLENQRTSDIGLSVNSNDSYDRLEPPKYPIAANNVDGNNHKSFHHNQRARYINGTIVSATPNGAIFDLVDSTKNRFIRFFHSQILASDSFNCYLGFGEHYSGNISQSIDYRPCLNWLMLRKTPLGLSARDQIIERGGNHNHCRNPNSDPRGPWCFVQYVEVLDGQMSSEAVTLGISDGPHKTKFVARQCPVSPCFKYLWMYIVAPPIGLLLVFIFILSTLIRSMRRSYYNRCIRSIGKTLPRMHKIKFLSRGPFRTPKTNCVGGYMYDDIFEIVDDIDYSDGLASSSNMSPKSVESVKLRSSSRNDSSTSSETNHRTTRKGFNRLQPLMKGEKSVKKIFDSNHLDVPSEDHLKSKVEDHSRFVPGQCNGPIFATLRCHFKDLSSRRVNQDMSDHRSKALDGEKHDGLESLDDSISGLCSSKFNPSKQSAAYDCDKLISCSTTLEGIETLDAEGDTSEDMSKNPKRTGKHIKAINLPPLDESNIFIDHEKELIFEGKFSQVQVAQVKRQIAKRSESGSGKDMDLITSNDIGLQVAILSLKPSAGASAVDPNVFDPSVLGLKNLNHLNIVKLIGCIQHQDNQGSCPRRSCSLVFDMSQLVDFGDWLKQRNSDSITIQGIHSEALRLRRNLTCLAKQAALALDYLHDRDIIYKDLGCRNCFIDPTKMLIKLAGFNQELNLDMHEESDGISDSSIHSSRYLKTMIRPKYLLDYYIIDSRPSDCQMLPLSWIPLESILFNKFNKQTDIWSFGCLIYELFSLGEIAFFGYSCKQVIDAVRSNLMPPQPSLCPNGIYNLMCKCLSDIPTSRPSIKQIYEQLNLYSGQCSSFLDHHLCSLATTMYDDTQSSGLVNRPDQTLQLFPNHSNAFRADSFREISHNSPSISKTKSYANMGSLQQSDKLQRRNQDNLCSAKLAHLIDIEPRSNISKIPLSKSINLGANKLMTLNSDDIVSHHYAEPTIDCEQP